MRTITRTIAAMFAFGWAALASFVALAPTAHAAISHSVAMSDYAFAPTGITVQVGDSISWTNHDQAPHNVVTTSAPVAINSPMLSDGQSWSYTFAVPGTYHYICGVHPDMHATVVVLAAAPSTTAQARPSHPATPARPAKAASMPVMASPHSGTSSDSTPSSPPSHPRSTTTAGAAAPATSPASAAAAGAVTTATGVTTARLRPLLLVAGVIAAVTVFCLLALASRPGSTPAD
jgi:plastocyanin